MYVLGHQSLFHQKPPRDKPNQVQRKMASTVAKFGPTFKKGAVGTAGAREDSSPVAAKCQKTAESANNWVSANFDAWTWGLNPPRGTSNGANRSGTRTPPTAKVVMGGKGPEVIPLDNKDDSTTGAAARANSCGPSQDKGKEDTQAGLCAWAFGNNALVLRVLDAQFLVARAFGPRVDGNETMEVDATMPVAAAAACKRSNDQTQR
jgi:hypothetical protein